MTELISRRLAHVHLDTDPGGSCRIPSVQAKAGSNSVVPPGAKLEKVWGEASSPKGARWPRDGSILFSDIGNRIMRFDPTTGKTTVFREPSGRANGLIFDARAADRRRGGQHRRRPAGLDHRTRRHGPHPRRQLQGQAVQQPQRRGRRPGGRVYVSDPRYVGDEPRELDFEGVFRIDPDGSVIRLGHDRPQAQRPGRQPRRQDPLRRPTTGPGAGPCSRRPIGDRGKVTRAARDPRLRQRPRHRRHDRHHRRPDRRGRRRRGQGRASTSSRPRASSSASSPLRKTRPTSSSAAMMARCSTSCAGKSLYRIKTTMTGFALWPPTAPAASSLEDAG